MNNYETVIDNNNELARMWELAEGDRILKAALKHEPLCATFELTPLCNLACKMCYIRLSTEEMNRIGRHLTTEEWLKLARETAGMGTLNLLLTGGEPIIRPDFAELYTELAHMGFIITLNSNAAMITPKICDLLAKYPPTGIDVTLYGASPQTYGKICGDPGAFERVMKGLELLSVLPTKLQIRTTFIKDNQNEYDAIHKIADRFTSSFAINPFITQPVRGAVRDVSNIRMTAEEIFALEHQTVEYYRKKREGNEPLQSKVKTREELIGVDRIALEKYMVDKLNGIAPTTLHCSAGKSMYSITWDGKMVACLNFATPYSLPVEEGLKPAWDRLPELYENIPVCSECKTCDAAGYCQNCPGYLQAETGQTDKAAPYICSVAKHRKKIFSQAKR